MMPTLWAGLIAVAAITATYLSCVRPHLRRWGCAASSSSVQDTDMDPRRAAAPRWLALQLFIGVAAAVAVVAVIGHCEPSLSGQHASHAPHRLLPSPGGEFTVNAEHAHLVDASSPACHEPVMTAVLPRSGTASVGHGAVTAAVAITGWQAQPAALTVRGPPGALGPALTGQDILRRFCLARR
jgi:lipoprotein LpqS